MTHIIYHTEAIVLGGSASEEGSKFLHLLTKDFGFIIAHARSVRAAKSKLRYSLQDFSYSHIDLVRAKSGWRITSAEYIKSFFQYSGKAAQGDTFRIIGRISNLLKRLLGGEEKNEILFEDVRNGFLFLSYEELSGEDAIAVEIILMMRILNHLGYWDKNSTHSLFQTDYIGDRELISNVKKQKIRAIKAINKALAETQL